MLSTDFTDYTDRESTLAGDARGELGIGQMAPRADFRHGRKPPSAGSCGGWVGAQSVESVKSVDPLLDLKSWDESSPICATCGSCFFLTGCLRCRSFVVGTGWWPYAGTFGGPSLKPILRAILAFALLLGGGAADWAPGTVAAAHACCCGEAAGVEDTCPCPKPESNRGPQRGTCDARSGAVVALQASRRGEQAPRRVEASPAPAGWDRAAVEPGTEALVGRTGRGRDPDLGRHLALLDTFRI